MDMYREGGDKDMYAQNPENFDKIQISWKI